MSGLSGRNTASFWLRIALPAAAALALFAVSVFALVIPRFAGELRRIKIEASRDSCYLAIKILDAYAAQAGSGFISLAEAQGQAAKKIESIRWGENGRNYFWLQDKDLLIRAHPHRQEMTGQILAGFKDIYGRPLAETMDKIARDQGGGFIDYYWQLREDKNKVVMKTSYVCLYPEWGWVVGTGVYLDEVQAEVDRVRLRVFYISLAVFALVSALVAGLVRQSLNLENAREKVAGEREALVQNLARKNAELESFAYSASHDLKSPLITIRGFVSALKEDLAANDRENIDNDILRITEGAERLQQLLEQVLAVSKAGLCPVPELKVDMAGLLATVLSSLKGIIDQSGAAVTVAPGLPEVKGDALRLGEVFQNLIENAIKYAGEGNTPRVAISSAIDKETGKAVFRVEDNGIGIDSRYLERVFMLFEQLDPDQEGTGVGLTLSRRIVDQHGGSIRAESAGVGRGCVFVVELPLFIS